MPNVLNQANTSSEGSSNSPLADVLFRTSFLNKSEDPTKGYSCINIHSECLYQVATSKRNRETLKESPPAMLASSTSSGHASAIT